MKKRLFVVALAAAVAVMGLAAGCDDKKEEETVETERQIRFVPDYYSYEIETKDHTVEYTDAQGRAISIYGQICQPVKDEKFPAVVLSHGYNGHYSDFGLECAKWAKRGYICYAFDFCGAQQDGLSTGRASNEYTPYTMKEDLIAIIGNIKQLPNVDATQIFLFGGSQGGFVTALTAADDAVKEQVAAIAMYFPAFNIPDDWRNAEIKDSSPPGMGYVIGAEYIRSIRSLDLFDVIGNYKKDVCIVWGTDDAIVRKEYIDRAVEVYGAERVERTDLAGTGHGFGGSFTETAAEKVLKFLEARTYET